MKLNLSRKHYFGGLIIAAVLIVWFIASPPRFWVNMTHEVEVNAVVGEQIVAEYNCRQYHNIGGAGALKAPSLAGVTKRLDEVSIRLWLRNPKAVKGNTAMPNFHLSDTQIEAIVAYLESLEK